MQSAPTQSLLNVVYGILDETAGTMNGEIPHVWVYDEPMAIIYLCLMCTFGLNILHIYIVCMFLSCYEKMMTLTLLTSMWLVS